MRVWIGMALVCLGLAGPAWSQEGEALPATFAAGLKAAAAGQHAAAARHFEDVFLVEPAFAVPGKGSAAYWLGWALDQQGAHERALNAWKAGLGALDVAGRVDVRLADAFARRIYRNELQADYARAADAYLDLLAQAGATRDDEESDIVARHVAQMAFLLPDDVAAGAWEEDRRGRLRLRHGAGAVLVSWWRSQDPQPATQQNERAVEHLERVAYAERYYPYPREAIGFDDRGMIYVRLGPPQNKTSIRLTDRGIEGGSAWRSGAALNDNEFWSYRHIALPVYYLFVDRGGRYQIGTPEELVPEHLLRATRTAGAMVGGSTRGDALIELWQMIYGQLALHHPDFAARSSEIDDRVAGRVTGTTAETFARVNRMRYRRMDEESAEKRDRAAPRVFSHALVEAEALPVEVRVARFLDDNGTTRTEIYWIHPEGSFSPDSRSRKAFERENVRDTGEYLIALSAVQKDARYRFRDVTRQRYLVRSDAGGDGLAVRTLRLSGDTALYHLGLQWDEYLSLGLSADGRVRVGPRFKAGIYRVDSLAALAAGANTLEMSDLMPIFAPDQAKGAGQDLTPYPFSAISPSTALALYFEVYHLAFGAEDRARYTVAYEVERARGGRAQSRIGASSLYTSGSRTAREYVMVDLREWNEKGPVRVTVRITDETTGQQVSRSVGFNVVD